MVAAIAETEDRAQTLQGITEKKLSEVERYSTTVETLSSQLEEASVIGNTAKEQVKHYSATVETLSSKLEEANVIGNKAKEQVALFRKVIAVILVIALGAFIWFQPSVAPVSWFDQHAKNALIRSLLFASITTIGFWIALPKLHISIWAPLILVFIASLITAMG